MRTYRYLPGKYMEVVTFEVKPFDAIDVKAVYEALAHLRSSTHAYVILHVPNGQDEQDESVKLTIDETCHVGRSHGVGVIVMGDPADWDTWDEKEEARRVEPDRCGHLIRRSMEGVRPVRRNPYSQVSVLPDVRHGRRSLAPSGQSVRKL